MAEVFVGGFAVPAGEGIRVDFSSDSVDTDGEVVVGNRSVASLDAPQGFGKTANSSRRIENNFSSI